MKIRLVTDYDGLVHENEIPPFASMSVVILWGTRMFAYAYCSLTGVPTYREVFYYVLPFYMPSKPE